MTKKKAILLISGICILTFIVVVSYISYVQANNRTKAIENVLKADEGALKAELDLYHAVEGRYPPNLKKLKENLIADDKSFNSKDVHVLDSILTGELGLPKLTYYVRESDYQAYKFTYKDTLSGETRTIQTDFTTDLQKTN